MGLLDIYNASQAQLTVNDPDLITQYPATSTGTPTPTQNPGGPVKNFDQAYDSNRTYLSTVVASGLSTLENTLPITNLDVEDSGVQGGPNPDITTQYPNSVTGTPTGTQNPGGPVRRFTQPWLPTQTYLSANPVAGLNSGFLNNTLKITNLDVENPNVQGGPNPDITTQYPALVSGTPTPTQNPGGPVRRFTQPWLPTQTYLTANPILGVNSGKLKNTLPITNLDVEDSGVLGGPNADIITQYPALATGTPDRATNVSATAPFVSGTPPKNFIPSWAPNNTYLNTNQIAGTNSGVLYDTLGITNYDVNDPNVNGGPLDDTSTVYPQLVTGTPNPFANPAAPRNFSQFWLPNNTYLAFNPIKGINSGILRNTLKVTNLDTSSPGVDGGIPYDQYKDPTIYPVDTNHTEPTRGYFAQPGTPPNKFYQTYDSTNTYSDFIKAYI